MTSELDITPMRATAFASIDYAFRGISLLGMHTSTAYNNTILYCFKDDK